MNNKQVSEITSIVTNLVENRATKKVGFMTKLQLMPIVNKAEGCATIKEAVVVIRSNALTIKNLLGVSDADFQACIEERENLEV
jgi:hypothetical protein